MVSPLDLNDNVVVTITLSEPVENLSFTIHDIDSTQNGWRDGVIIGTSGYTYVRGSNIRGVGANSGSGMSNGPFRPTSWGDTPISSGQGDVQLTWAGPVQQVVFTYRALISGNSQNQHIGIGNISFTDCVVEPNGFAGPASTSRSVGVSSQRGMIASTMSMDESSDL